MRPVVIYHVYNDPAAVHFFARGARLLYRSFTSTYVYVVSVKKPF